MDVASRITIARRRLRWGGALAAAISLAAALGAPALAAGPGTTLLLSRPSGLGALPSGGDNFSTAADRAVSGDGRFVVFTSGADDLGVRDVLSHVWLRDTQSDQTRLLDKAPGGTPADGSGFSASISRDGTTACFSSTASNLVSGITGAHLYVVKISSGATTVADRSDGPEGTLANDTPTACSLDANGTHVAFTSNASNLVAGDTNTRSDVFVRDLVGATTTRVSVSNAGAEAPAGGSEPSITADGNKIAFTSGSALVAADTNQSDDVYMRDVLATTTTRVSVATGGGQATGDSSHASVSDTGASVAFESTAANLDLGADTNDSSDVFVRIIGADTTFAVSRATTAVGALADDDSSDPAISGNGAAVAFRSAASNLSEGGDHRGRVYMRTLGTNETTLISRASGASGAAASDAFGFGALSVPTLPSAVVWGSRAENLDPSATGDFTEVFRRALADPFPTELISRPSGNSLRSSAVNDSFAAGARAVSADGRIVVFVSNADGLDPAGFSRTQQIFARDTLTNETILVSRSQGLLGVAANSFSQQPSISADGRRVAFVSDATNLLPGGNEPGVFVRDLVTGELIVASRADGVDGAPVSGMLLDGGTLPAIDAEGSRVAFATFSKILPTDTNPEQDVYVRDLSSGTTTLASLSAGGTVGNNRSSSPAISADGTKVAFMSTATNLVDPSPPPAPPFGTHIYVRDLAVATTQLVDRTADGAAGTGSAFFPQISADGTRVAFGDEIALTAEPIVQRGFYVRDLAASTTTLASRVDGPSGAALTPTSNAVVLSGDGRHVAFPAPGLTTAPLSQVYVRDLGAGTTRIVSVADGASGAEASRGASGGALSHDGGCVAFSARDGSMASPAYDTDDFSQAYMRVVSGNCPPLTLGPPATTPPPGTDKTAPVIARASISPSRFRLGAKLTPLSATIAKRRAPRSTTIRFTLSEAATLRIVIARRAAGRRSGARCVKPTRALRRKRACTRIVKLVTLRRVAPAGARSTAFSGRWSRRGALKPGVHQAALQATDTAGNRSRTRTVRFTVVR